VDDGSTDDTLARVPDDPRVVKVRHERRLGVAAARNTGIAAGRSTFVALLDADDYWLPGKLPRQIGAMRPDVALSCTDFFDFDATGIRRESLTTEHVPASGKILEHLLKDFFVKTSTVLLRRAALPAERPFDESLARCEDRDLFLRLSAKHEVVFDPAVLVGVRTHSANALKDPVEYALDKARVFEKAIGWLDAPELRAIARTKLAEAYREVGWVLSTRDLPGALAGYARALRSGAGAEAIGGLLKAPLRRWLLSEGEPGNRSAAA
jgi:glycosyltransferase involved in cell wall biosynthesis